MAHASPFAYVKHFESDTDLLRNCWIVVRLDGWSFGTFTTEHKYSKPVDDRGVALMNTCAERLLDAFPEVLLAYGHSDEFSFVLKKNTDFFKRRRSKIESLLASTFTAWFVMLFPRFFKGEELQSPPTFDARAVCYPSDENLRDYLSWRQVDCHVNNQFNYCFWTLVKQKGLDKDQSMQHLRGTDTEYKNELLFKEAHTNYNDLPASHRRGSTLSRTPRLGPADRRGTRPVRWTVSTTHDDLVQDAFWTRRPWLLASATHSKAQMNALVRAALEAEEEEG